MSSVLGVDFSSFEIFFATLDEDAQAASWSSVVLTGKEAWERTRQLRTQMPRATFYDDVYLAAIEKPFGFSSRSGQSVLMRTQGAILVSIPAAVAVWEVRPADWKGPLGLKQSEKPTCATFAAVGFDLDADGWPQDALDALGLALYARDVNAAGIARRLEEVVDLT